MLLSEVEGKAEIQKLLICSESPADFRLTVMRFELLLGEIFVTPPKTNECPLKINGWRTGPFLGNMLVFRGVNGLGVRKKPSCWFKQVLMMTTTIVSVFLWDF